MIICHTRENYSYLNNDRYNTKGEFNEKNI